MDSIKKAPGISQVPQAESPEKKKEPSPPPATPDQVSLSTSLASLGSGLEPGEKVVVKIGGKKAAEITKVGKSRWDSFKDKVTDTTKRFFRTAGELVAEDPAFAFTKTVELTRNSLLTDTPGPVAELVKKGLLPTTRVAALMLDADRAWKTLRDPGAKWVSKVIDVGHVVTDVAGVAASLGHWFPAMVMPGAPLLMAAAIIGDIISFSTHAMVYLQRKAAESHPDSPKPGPGKAEPSRGV